MGTAPCRPGSAPPPGSAGRLAGRGTRRRPGRGSRTPRAPCGRTDTPRSRRAPAAAPAACRRPPPTCRCRVAPPRRRARWRRRRNGAGRRPWGAEPSSIARGRKSDAHALPRPGPEPPALQQPRAPRSRAPRRARAIAAPRWRTWVTSHAVPRRNTQKAISAREQRKPRVARAAECAAHHEVDRHQWLAHGEHPDEAHRVRDDRRVVDEEPRDGARRQEQQQPANRHQRERHRLRRPPAALGQLRVSRRPGAGRPGRRRRRRSRDRAGTRGRARARR